jgi:hypothetical protein
MVVMADLPNTAGSLRLIKEGRYHAARDMLHDRLAEWTARLAG